LITNAFPFPKNGLRKYFAFSILQTLFNKVFHKTVFFTIGKVKQSFIMLIISWIKKTGPLLRKREDFLHSITDTAHLS